MTFSSNLKKVFYFPQQGHLPTGESRSHRPDIQWLRGLAVIAVILFHAKDSLFSNGFLGVDVFFVISGYVVAPLLIQVFVGESLNEIITRLLSFYQRRFWRLVPTLGFVLGTSVFLIFLFGSPSEHWRIAQQGLYSLIIIGNLGAVKFSGDYFSPTPNPFIHTWSLSVEEQFYLGLPLIFLLFIFLTKNRNEFKSKALILFTLLSFASFSLPVFFSKPFTRFGFPTEIDFAFYSGVTRSWQFLIGFGVYVISSKRKDNSNSSLTGSFAFVVIIILLFTNLEVGTYLGSCLASIFTLVALYFGITQKYITALSRPLVWVGDRSYSLYLVHMPLLYLAKYSPMFEISSRLDRSIQSFTAVLATFVTGSLIHGTIEQQSRGIGKSLLPALRLKIRFIVLTLLIPVILLTALNFAVRNNYWGLMHNLHTPQYPGFLDPKCQRDSDSGPPCIYTSKSGDSTVLLIGDSHAGQYSEALIDASRKNNWNTVIWAKGSCTFIVGNDNSDSLSESCLVRNKKILDWISVNQPQAVIVSNYIYQTSNQADLKRSLIAVRNLSPKVGIVENNPVFPDDRDFMVAKPLVMNPYNAPKSFRIDEMNFRDHHASAKLMTWAHDSGIQVLRTWPLFCDDGFCSRFAGNKWLYTDDNHLSITGANRIIPQFQDFLISKSSR